MDPQQSQQPVQKVVSYRDLKVWQKGMDLVELTYELASKLPAFEKYGLAAQMCRAAVSVPSNIAEGWGRKHRAEYINHLSIANGSLKELETQILICIRLRQVQESDTKAALGLAEEIGRMLAVMIQKLRANTPKRSLPTTPSPYSLPLIGWKSNHRSAVPQTLPA